LRSSFLPFALPDSDEAEINEILSGLEPGRTGKKMGDFALHGVLQLSIVVD
jgi:hypothetical protein